MSTPGGLRRPTIKKSADKAVAAEGDKPEEVEEAEATPAPSGTDKAPVGKPVSSRAGGAAKPATKSSPAKASAGGRGGAKVGQGKGGTGKGGAGKGGPAKSGGGKGRKPIAPVRVAQQRNWGPIALFTAAAVLAVAIIGFAVWQVVKKTNENNVDDTAWQERAAAIPGVSNYLQSNPEWFQVGADGNHRNGLITYEASPPVGGVHNPVWQNCMGNVYTAQIAKEQAVHSLEHGAVWITYRPDLPKDQVDQLAEKVNGRGYMLMSPYPGLTEPISLQAWGYQLKVDKADDGRIDQFISALRQNASQEEGATCSQGITDATDRPLDLVKVNPGG